MIFGTMILVAAFLVFLVFYLIRLKNTKSHRERLSSTQRMAEMQLRQMDVLRQRNTIRDIVGLDALRNNGDGNGWIEDREDPRYVPEYLRVNFNKANPKEGDIREECIIANQPEKGVRVYEFRSGRWHLRSTLKPVEFLTEEDVMI